MPGPFGIKQTRAGTSNLALEGALDGRRRRTIDFLPERMQHELQKEDETYLQSLSSQAACQKHLMHISWAIDPCMVFRQGRMPRRCSALLQVSEG